MNQLRHFVKDKWTKNNEPSPEDDDTTDYFLGPDPRKHKDYKRLKGDKK
jgi:hypothetical protein